MAKRLKITAQIKLGNVYQCQYSAEGYAYKELISLLSASRAVFQRVTTSSRSFSEGNAILSFKTFLEGADFFSELADEPGEVSIRLLGNYEKANITVAMDPADLSTLLYSSDDITVSLKDVLGVPDTEEPGD